MLLGIFLCSLVITQNRKINFGQFTFTTWTNVCLYGQAMIKTSCMSNLEMCLSDYFEAQNSRKKQSNVKRKLQDPAGMASYFWYKRSDGIKPYEYMCTNTVQRAHINPFNIVHPRN